MDPPFYSSILWPVYNIIEAIKLPDGVKDRSPSTTADTPPYLSLLDHVSVALGAVRAFIMSYIAIYVISPVFQPRGIYPAFGGAEEWSLSWTLPIVLRNVLATWVICGFWDWFLYFSPLKDKLSPYKINPSYPSRSQFIHDALWTTSATCTASLIECFCCYAYCNSLFPRFSNLSWSVGNILWVLFITHWRVPHFYLVHRVMHPWRTSFIPDLGKILYTHVHSLHHKSYNPTAFSGTSMHPVESTLYYSACFIAVPFGCHPSIVLACIIDCAVGAWLGHDGFTFPGSGDSFHQLHHAHFDCNYGTSIDSIDYWMGTAISSKSDIKRIKNKNK
mmetsp:Transcript_16087/g.24245  ORF Transcript_16087/g.24245 Transcript_16087/m.24245 type:complete len:332 (+) Transcript_16087:54-1049(+)